MDQLHTDEAWDRGAAGWNRHAPAIRRWLQGPTDIMIRMAGVQAGNRVIDVAAGAGDQTLDLARVLGPKGRVVAVDRSPGILRYAAENAEAAGFANVDTHLADAADLHLPAASFHAAVCRLGLMFLPDPLAGLREIRSVLAPGGRFCSMVFAGPEVNPCIRILMSTALRHAGLPPRDPFLPGGLLSLGRPGALDGMFRQAGFFNVATTRIEAPFCLAATADYMAFIADAAAPILQILSALDAPAHAAALADMAGQLDAFQTTGEWVGPNSLLLTAGQR